MFTSEYVAEQCAAIHNDNRKKGFWDEPKSALKNQGLVASEIMEAFEAIRKDKRANAKAVADCQLFVQDMKEDGTGSPMLSDFYAFYIKDTVEAEMAGTCIRCFDGIGARLYEGNGYIMDSGMGREDALDLATISEAVEARVDACLKGAVAVTSAEDLAVFPEMLVDAILPALGVQNRDERYNLTGVYPRITELNSYVETLKNMAMLATWYNIDLLTHIKLEVAFNRTRTHKHGKQF